MIKTKSIYDPIEEEDGVRVLITRYYPRGVKKSSFDLWIRALSPSRGLLSEYRDGKMDWEEFEKRFTEEFTSGEESMGEIIRLREMSSRGTVTLLCYEREGNCHRFRVRDLITGTG